MSEKKEIQKDPIKIIATKIAKILDNEVQVKGNSIVIKKTRDIKVEVAGFDKSHDDHIVGASLDIQVIKLENNKHRALVIGEISLLEKEVKKAEIELREVNVTIGAVHNRLLFDQPKIVYLHFQKISEDLIEFAKAIAELWKEL